MKPYRNRIQLSQLPAPAQVRSHFRPEFINRIDEFIIFDPLKLQQIRSIVMLQVWEAIWYEGGRN